MEYLRFVRRSSDSSRSPERRRKRGPDVIEFVFPDLTVFADPRKEHWQSVGPDLSDCFDGLGRGRSCGVPFCIDLQPFGQALASVTRFPVAAQEEESLGK